MLLRAALGPKFSVGMVGPNKELGGWGSVLFAYSGLVDCLDGFFGNCWVDGFGWLWNCGPFPRNRSNIFQDASLPFITCSQNGMSLADM